MADIVMLGVMFEDAQNKANDTPVPTHAVKKTQNNMSVLGLLIGIYAAYLSWTCNTVKGVDTVGKVIYSIFAFMFGGIYLLYYFLVNRPCVVQAPVAYYF